jgi:uncharacterized repeat protein (TIGR03843 family)
VASQPVSTLDHVRSVERLTSDPLRVEGRMPWSSNATFLVTLGQGLEPHHDHEGPSSAADSDDDQDDDDDENAPRLGLPEKPVGAIRGIYKPGRGERPLWDFPRGLFRREIGAYELSRFLDWDVIPPTVLRDADYGPGSLQMFVETDFNKHYFVFLEDEALHPQLKRMAAFDIVANNTDRKGGHVLADADGHLWGIDNGLCFNEDPKLRTVIWDFAGEALPADLRPDLERLATVTHTDIGPLCGLLSTEELTAMQRRAITLLDRGELPAPRSDHAYPWPLV